MIHFILLNLLFFGQFQLEYRWNFYEWIIFIQEEKKAVIIIELFFIIISIIFEKIF